MVCANWKHGGWNYIILQSSCWFCLSAQVNQVRHLLFIPLLLRNKKHQSFHLLPCNQIFQLIYSNMSDPMSQWFQVPLQLPCGKLKIWWVSLHSLLQCCFHLCPLFPLFFVFILFGNALYRHFFWTCKFLFSGVVLSSKTKFWKNI